ncbi:YheT family hydrolase [Chitinibacter tainanensis]|uniref:YheT family hydrolase n=1 Tax=Chitinibacter tainanensis TaxID=230667 RepID=UPI0027E59C19|nr:alpha/beta fold hydrolase [Chitinibacter tainanensis]
MRHTFAMAREKELILPSYQPARWLPGGHAQTIYPAVLLWQRALSYRREHWITPDLDAIGVDWTAGRAGTPLIVLFHGLEGGSRSHYAVSLFQQAYQQGWRGVVPHFRTCGNVPNRLPRSYHAGDSAEIDWVLRRLKKEHPGTPIFAVGYSLGGNALLKWLGEQGSRAGEFIHAAAAVSAPMDLTAAGVALDDGLNRHIYTRNFLRTMRKKAQYKLKLTENPFIDWRQVKGVKTLREFDDLVTAPLHGFFGVDEYWAQASSKPLLPNIAIPTLIINALNDPFIPAQSLPTAQQVSEHVQLLQPRDGGHVGFLSGPPPGRLQWLPSTLLKFFTFHLPLVR